MELNDVQVILKEPKHNREIGKAIKYQNRLKFHTEKYLSTFDAGLPLTDFLNDVKQRLPLDKYNFFLQLFRFPIQTVELVSRIYKELERVFNGRNAAVIYNFLDSKYADDWEYYRQDVLHEPDIWHEKGWNALKTSINSVLVVDLPREQKGTLPEPYFYWLDISHVYDYKTENGEMTLLIYYVEKDVLAILDDEYYRLVRVNDRKEIIETLNESRHDLGYCPAMFFWSTALNSREPDIKDSPIADQLDNLDWLLFYKVSKRQLDMYAPYPIYSGYQQDCSYRNNQTGEYCDGSYLRNAQGSYVITNEGAIKECPICGTKKIRGPGSYIEIPVPTNDTKDLRKPIEITGIDRESLDYNVEEVRRIEDSIFRAIVGEDGELQKTKAINELQVESNYESRTTVLLSLKRNFEKAQKFVDDTVCRLRYGKYFLNSNINWGTEFYLYSVEDLQNIYDKAKQSGASESRLDMISDLIISTENRNNPVQLQRMLILKQLEPYRHKTFNELMQIANKDLIDPVLLELKLNFSNYIDTFERNNINIIEFGANLDFGRKIEIITEKLKEYAKRNIGQIARGSSRTAQTGVSEGNERGIRRNINGNESGSGE